VLAVALAAGSARAAATDPQVAGLQVALAARGLYSGPIDGRQGPGTRAATVAFQRRARLVDDGIAGPRTRRALGRLGGPLYGTRVLRRGKVGWDVAVLQFLLGRDGFPTGPPDGSFGERTEAALVAFQRAHGLPPDGVLGPRTAAALCSLPACAFRRRAGGRILRTEPVAARVVRYVVRPGDTLSAIGGCYGLPISAIAKANGLDPFGILLAGAVLQLPLEHSASGSGCAGSVRPRLDHWSLVYGVDPHLVRALAWMESGYQQELVSVAGAVGVMQVTPSTWSYVEDVLLGRPVTHDLEGNIEVGVVFLRHLLREFGDDRTLALAAYYQGERSVRERGVLPESRLYVADVLALAQRL